MNLDLGYVGIVIKAKFNTIAPICSHLDFIGRTLRNTNYWEGFGVFVQYDFINRQRRWVAGSAKYAILTSLSVG